MVSALVSGADRAARVRVLAGDTVLSSWVRHARYLSPSSCVNGYRRIR